jgi:transposase
MVRPARGKEVSASVKDALSKARTAEELRLAQAVILTLEYGLSIDQVAAILGISKSWACKLRTSFIRAGGWQEEPKAKRGVRRRENMSKEE